MSGSSALRWVCHAAVLGWLAVLAAAASLDAPLADGTDAPAEELAHVRPVPLEPAPPEEPEPTPEPEVAASPPPEPEPAVAEAKPPAPEPEPAAPEPQPQRVAASDVARGGELLGGDFPILSSSYESFPSFAAYARAMQSLGAQFVVVQRREIVGRVDVATGDIGEPRIAAAFSPRARDYTGEAGLAPLARRARERFGSDAVVMMLVPRALDAGLFGGIARALAERGADHGDFREFRGRYERSGGRVVLRVEDGVRRDGSAVALNLLFDLDSLVRGAHT